MVESTPNVASIRTKQFQDSSLLVFWIYFSAWASASGWILSALHLLNRTGYVISFLFALLLLWKRIQVLSFPKINFRKLRKRFTRPMPGLYLFIAALALIGGLLYSPNNYDFLTYRFPRVLHWAAQNSWHWIHTVDPRLNYSAAGFEWLMPPLFMFLKTDRFFFLINFVSFLFLPGLVFSVFRHLRISRNLSWTFMWLLPTGYCFVLQAGSVGNDAFSAIYLLAALGFAFRAREQGSAHDLFVSFLAICLMTGAKLSNLPLVLPWLIVSWKPIVNQSVKYPTQAMASGFLGLMISVLPVLFLNLYHTGEWTGDPANTGTFRVRPVAGIAGNSLQLLTANLTPPVFPWAPEWNKSIPEIPFVKNGFPRFSLQTGEIQMEESAGAGFGLFLFCLLVLFAGIFQKKKGYNLSMMVKLWIACVFLAMLILMGSFGSESFPRLFSPYYVIEIAAALLCLNLQLPKTRFWRLLAFFAGFSVMIPLILSPSRPLWPALKILTVAHGKYPQSYSLKRALNVYSVYRDRSNCFAPLKGFIPDQVERVGLISTGDDPESPLWNPFGMRKIIEFYPDDLPCDHSVSIVVIHETALPSGIRNWLSRNRGEVIGEKRIIIKNSIGPQSWLVVKLNCFSRHDSSEWNIF